MSVLVDGQVDGRRTAGSPARSRRLKLTDDGQRPCAQMRYVPVRPGAPRQPARPLAGVSYAVASPIASRGVVVSRSAAGGDLKLSDRGLALVMIGFLLAVALGAWVVVSQYLALVP